jgi:signal transduction histidine kinase
MQRLIDDLLDYSRAGGGQLLRTDVDCAALVGRVLETFAAPIAESGATIRVGDLPTRISADEGLLERVFQNLIGNALKFRGAAPPVVGIDAERLDHSWRFSVSDNGIGIAAGEEDRIFRMFHRLHARDRYVGTGIGLTVSKTVVARHGGRIWHEPAEPTGSRFIFTIADPTGTS